MKNRIPDGNKSGFPSQDMVRDAIYSGSQFIGVENEYAGTAAITYADIGVPMQFKLYELILV